MGCEEVYCGVWGNWSKGKYWGSTITLPKEYGSIIIALIALFVGIAGTHLWGILSFAIHQLRATSRKHDSIFYQIQVLLKNSRNPASMAWSATEVFLGQRTWKSSLRLLPLMLFATCFMAALAAAGLLSSQFILSTDEGLSRAKHCGWMRDVQDNSNFTADPGAINVANALLVAGRASYEKSLQYSLSCYNAGQAPSDPLCGTFFEPIIPSQVSDSAECPFSKDICATRAIAIDTGPIKSDHHLGINSNPRDSVSIRKVMTCAPLLGEKYSPGWQPFPEELNPPIPGDSMKTYDFGPLLSEDDFDWNYTFAIGNFTQYFHQTPYEFWFADYLDQNVSASTFMPRDELKVNASDIFITGLRNSAAFIGEVNDPWFNATYKINGSEPPVYISSNELSFIACTVQYQVCSITGCSELGSLAEISPEKSSLLLNASQKAILMLLWKAIWATQMKYAVRILESSILLANNYLWDRQFLSGPLPSNQWQNEVLNWHNVSLALFQRRITEFASPPNIQVRPGVRSVEYLQLPETHELQNLCNAIKIRTRAYYSFSMFGIMLTIGIGSLIIVTHWSLSSVVGSYRRRTNKNLAKQKEWVEMNSIHLLRHALEGRGVGPWIEKMDVPIMANEEFKFSFVELMESAAENTNLLSEEK